jgi:quinol monooxygenase YgiN
MLVVRLLQLIRIQRSLDVNSIITLLTYEFEPGVREQWLSHFAAFAPTFREEPGTIALFAVPDPDSKIRVHIFEHYRDAQAFKEHIGSPHLEAFREAIRSAGVEPMARVVRSYSARERGF